MEGNNSLLFCICQNSHNEYVLLSQEKYIIFNGVIFLITNLSVISLSRLMIMDESQTDVLWLEFNALHRQFPSFLPTYHPSKLLRFSQAHRHLIFQGMPFVEFVVFVQPQKPLPSISFPGNRVCDADPPTPDPSEALWMKDTQMLRSGPIRVTLLEA